MIVENQLTKHMKSSLKSAGVPQASGKTTNAVSNFKKAKGKTLGSLDQYQQTAGIINS